MRMGNKGPHGRPWIWLMAGVAIPARVTPNPAGGGPRGQAPCSEKSRLDTRLHPIIGHGL